ncbi:MAG: hypothetical protein J4F47_11225 [Alphaproteobacteria bacterium]|nr:hypothetical protein [Alphaproteobacteria bacterium]
MNFESQAGSYRLLSYGNEPERRKLTATATRALRTLAMAVIRETPPGRSLHDGKHGR